MTDPGWYHGDGDPPGTKRYWDGTAWVGEPTADTASNQVIYYAAASETEVDLGDVAKRIALSDTEPTASYAQSPYSVSTGSVNLMRRPPIPEGLKSLTILVCVLKAIPLLTLGYGIASAINNAARNGSSIRRYGPPGLDFVNARAAAILVLLAIFVIGSGLVITQARSAINDDASALFSVAMVMLFFDALNTVNQWVSAARGSSYPPTVLITLVLMLQALVTGWAGLQTRRKHL